MEFKYIILYVADVKKTLAFYQKAFGFDIKFMTPEEDYGELSTGNTTISFASFELGNSNLRNGYLASDSSEKPFGIELAFITSRIQEDFKIATEAGAEVQEHIKEKPWGQQVAYLRDLNGFLIELATPLAE